VSTSLSGRVIPWAARVRAAVPLILAAACLLLFLVGTASRDVRTDHHLRPFLWTLLAGAAVFVGLWIVMLATLTAQLTVDDAGVRIAGRTSIDLGRPRTVRHGRVERAAPRGRPALHRWLAVEGADGRVVVLMRRSGRRDRATDWPMAKPPETVDLYDCGAVDPDSLRTALDAQR